MDTNELRRRLERTTRTIGALEARRRALRLAIEEAEGRGDGHEAVWLRAIITGDHATSSRCYAEWILGDGDRMHADSLRAAREELERLNGAGQRG